MRDFAPFKLNRSGVLLALIFAGFAGTAGAVAGRVEFSIGAATVSGTDGRERPLAKGAELDTGDTVRTKDGRAQIRFTDGAYVSLQPNTDFSIKEYRFDGKTDGSERGLFGLARGAMRTITGLIGRVNRNAYQIATPTATVGIRGTGGQIEIEPDLATLVRSSSGIWYLANLAGSIDVPAGTSARAPADPNTPPRDTGDMPANPPPPLPPGYRQGDDCKVRSDGSCDRLAGAIFPSTAPQPLPPLTSGPGYRIVAAFNPDGASVQTGTATATFNSLGQLTAATTTMPSAPALTGGVHAADGPSPSIGFQTDGILAWGRWNSCTSGCGFGSGTFHYVIGLPSPSLPGGTATYNLISATLPSDTGGPAGTRTFSGGFNFNFLTGTMTTTTMQVAAPDRTYVFGTAETTTLTGSLFQVLFFPTGCSGGCSADVKGFFSGGPNALRAGIGYLIFDGFRRIWGVAAFSKQ